MDDISFFEKDALAIRLEVCNQRSPLFLLSPGMNVTPVIILLQNSLLLNAVVFLFLVNLAAVLSRVR